MGPERKRGEAPVAQRPVAETVAPAAVEHPLLDLQRSAGNRAVARLVESSRGQSLDSATRGSMEARFGQEFGAVRVHTGESAAEATGMLGANAVTVGSDIMFAPGRYAPQRLTHELTHVVQQRGGGGQPGVAHEREADALAGRTAGDQPLTVTTASAAGAPQLDEPDHPALRPLTKKQEARMQTVVLDKLIEERMNWNDVGFTSEQDLARYINSQDTVDDAIYGLRKRIDRAVEVRGLRGAGQARGTPVEAGEQLGRGSHVQPEDELPEKKRLPEATELKPDEKLPPRNSDPRNTTWGVKKTSGGIWGDNQRPGNSRWWSDVPGVNDVTGGKPVTFKDGYPQFQPWARKTVSFNHTGDHPKDVALANQRLAEKEGWLKPDGTPNAAEADRWMKENKLTWHHVEDGTTMLAVPTALNDGVPHIGGAAGARAAEAEAAEAAAKAAATKGGGGTGGSAPPDSPPPPSAPPSPAPESPHGANAKAEPHTSTAPKPEVSGPHGGAEPHGGMGIGKLIGHGMTAYDAWGTAKHLWNAWGTEEFEGAVAEEGATWGSMLIHPILGPIAVQLVMGLIDRIGMVIEVLPKAMRDIAGGASTLLSIPERIAMVVLVRPLVVAWESLRPDNWDLHMPAPLAAATQALGSALWAKIGNLSPEDFHATIDKPLNTLGLPAATLTEFAKQLTAVVEIPEPDLLAMPPTELVALLQGTKLLRFVQDPEYLGDNAVFPEGHQDDEAYIRGQVRPAAELRSGLNPANWDLTKYPGGKDNADEHKLDIESAQLFGAAVWTKLNDLDLADFQKQSHMPISSFGLSDDQLNAAATAMADASLAHMLGAEVTDELIDYYKAALLQMTPEDLLAYLRHGLELKLTIAPGQAAQMAEEAVRAGQQPW